MQEVLAVAGAPERPARERRPFEVEAVPPEGGEALRDSPFALRGAEFPPVLLLDRGGGVRRHPLEGAPQVETDDRGAQDRVAHHHLGPGGGQRPGVELAA